MPGGSRRSVACGNPVCDGWASGAGASLLASGVGGPSPSHGRAAVRPLAVRGPGPRPRARSWSKSFFQTMRASSRLSSGSGKS
eukprot:4368694-Alexandrium_andersonii.AAC.1